MHRASVFSFIYLIMQTTCDRNGNPLRGVEETFGISSKFPQATVAAKEIGLPFVLERTGSMLRIYCHSAYRIFDRLSLRFGMHRSLSCLRFHRCWTFRESVARLAHSFDRGDANHLTNQPTCRFHFLTGEVARLFLPCF